MTDLTDERLAEFLSPTGDTLMPGLTEVEAMARELQRRRAGAGEPGWWLVIDGDGDVVIGFKQKYACHEHINETLDLNLDDEGIRRAVAKWRAVPVYAHPPAAPDADADQLWWKLFSAAEAMRHGGHRGYLVAVYDGWANQIRAIDAAKAGGRG